jgi:hypothetical protein
MFFLFQSSIFFLFHPRTFIFASFYTLRSAFLCILLRVWSVWKYYRVQLKINVTNKNLYYDQKQTLDTKINI